jgi:hypothetical protein
MYGVNKSPPRPQVLARRATEPIPEQIVVKTIGYAEPKIERNRSLDTDK